jgi:hypothetical protein
MLPATSALIFIFFFSQTGSFFVLRVGDGWMAAML